MTKTTRFFSFMLLFFTIYTVIYYAFVSLDYFIATEFIRFSFVVFFGVVSFLINSMIFRIIFNYDFYSSKLCN